jgi:hypothetical protein
MVPTFREQVIDIFAGNAGSGVAGDLRLVRFEGIRGEFC